MLSLLLYLANKIKAKLVVLRGAHTGVNTVWLVATDAANSGTLLGRKNFNDFLYAPASKRSVCTYFQRNVTIKASRGTSMLFFIFFSPFSSARFYNIN